MVAHANVVKCLLEKEFLGEEIGPIEFFQVGSARNKSASFWIAYRYTDAYLLGLANKWRVGDGVTVSADEGEDAFTASSSASSSMTGGSLEKRALTKDFWKSLMDGL